MPPDQRERRLQEICSAALKQDPGRRDEFLRTACGDDAELRHEVESLLGCESRLGDFLETPATAAIPNQSLVGQTLGPYAVESLLGAGGMGQVYAARDTRLGRLVALKILQPDVAADPERKRRLLLEAKAASALNDPHIVVLHDMGTAGEIDYLVMEYVRGETLDKVIARGALQINQARQYAAEIAGALSKAHKAGIIHRDLKPGNIMVTEEGTVKVLDFGLAKFTEEPRAAASAESGALVSAAGLIMGTAAYMSPEQAQGQPLDARSDIFSFGVLLYEMLTGQRPFQGSSRTTTLAAVVRQDPRPPAELNAAIPPDLESVVLRCLRKDPNERIQSAADLALALHPPPSLPLATAPPKRRVSLRWAALAGVSALAAAVFWLARPLPPHTIPQKASGLVRLTADSGLTMTPALSPDGKLVAYASDRSGEGNLDLWVKKVGGTEAVRLTRDQADDYAPSFSPDGRTIAFRSDRDGGGIYVIPALGGEPRRIAPLGRRPKFSPDGKWIAYWIGTEPNDNGSSFLVPGQAKVYIVSSTGGPSQEIRPEFAAAGYPVWTPDGRHLLFLGNRDPHVLQEWAVDWWVTPLDESEPVVATGANAAFQSLGLVSTSQAPEAWTADAAGVLVSAKLGDTINVWRVPISTRTWKVDGATRRLTFGTAMDVQPSIAGNYVAFSSLSGNVDVWSLPIDANQGRPTGNLQRLTHDASEHSYPAVSPDGKKIAFSSRRSRGRDIWLRDLGTGKEMPISFPQSSAMNPNFSPDSTALAYQAKEKGRAVSYVVSLAGGHADRLCEDCTDYGWSSDEKRFVLVGMFPARISVLDLASRRRTALLNDPEHLLWNARFSPDDRWVSFNATAPGRSQIFVAPVRSEIVPDSEWISIADTTWDDKPRWSPDGKMLYFASERDHFRCIWAQPLDARKHPLGPPIPIFHAHEARRSLAKLGPGSLSISVAHDKIVFNMSEQTGNLWIAKVDDQQ